MNAALYNGPKDLNVIDFPINEINDSELLVKVAACGICGTDFHIFNGESPSNPPVIIGHEYAGEIVSVGKNIKEFKEGDHIAINPNIHCGYCEFCKKGKINLCKNLKALGVTVNGGLAQYSIVPPSQAYIIPQDLSFETAAFAEPLSCCIHGIDQANIKIGDTVVILGAGSIGLLMLQLAKINGAASIIVVDPSQEKLNIAMELGAEYVLDSRSDKMESHINELTRFGPDIVIECSGNKEAAETAVKLSKRGGKVVLFGLSSFKTFIQINLQEIFHKEITIKTSLLNPFTFQTAVDLLAQKKISVDKFRINKILLQDSELKNLFTKKRDYSIIKNMVIPN